MCNIFKRKPDPQLINLEKYTNDVKRQKVPLPPPPIPGRGDRQWTKLELEMMDENRNKATEIYNKAKRK